jgi:hypothetical protein
MSQPDPLRPEARSGQNTKSWSQLVSELHELYCHWTAQTLSLRFALKLSNLLQLDRFEEDLNISRVRLKPPAPHRNSTVQPAALDPEIDDQQRDKILNEPCRFSDYRHSISVVAIFVRVRL